MFLQNLSESVEMYLKAMLEMGDREVLAIGRLAERLGVTTVSATEMIRKLGEMGLTNHIPYKGVILTEKGREVACNVMRRQRLWEVFLYEYLKIEWALVYELACSLEHATAPEVTEALALFLGNPTTCPRGNPIPAADGSFTPLDTFPLSEAAAGDALRVIAVNATSTEILRYLQERQILPGAEIAVLEVAPLQGPLNLKVGEREVALGLSIAEFVLVKGRK